MANASFHAKITADARQFVQQVELANQALQELTKAQSQQGSAGADSNAKVRKRSYDEAQDALKKEHSMRMRNDAQEKASLREKNEQTREQLQNAKAIAAANRAQTEAMITGRYALYDVANAYRGIAESAFRASKATAQTLVTVAQFESAFTAVERAASLDVGTEAFNEVRDSLIELSKEIPVAFDEISQIATLGAQMGIATADLTKFTEQIAAFAAVTGNTIDDTAEKFGRLSSLANVPSEEFENLASAVIFAGFNAVATEKEILKMAESIAGAATNAGYSASQIIGLSTALSSLAIPPEQARGVILRLFNDIQRAVDGSSDKIGAFAAVMGTTEQSARSLFRTNPEQFFSSFVGGLSQVENLTAVLDNLGIVETREINVLQRLSGNMDVYTKSLSDANQSYSEGTALANAYADTADNLEAKFQRLINSLDALAATAAAGFGEGMKDILEILIQVANATSKVVQSDLGQWMLPIITGATAVIGLLAGFRFVVSIATAQVLAMRVAVQKMGTMGGMVAKPFTNLKNALMGNMFAVQGTTGAVQFMTRAEIEAAIAAGTLDEAIGKQALTAGRATGATQLLSVALTAFGIAAAAASVIGIGAIIFQMNNMNREIGESVGGVSALAEAIQKDTDSYNNFGSALATTTLELRDNADAQEAVKDSIVTTIDAQGNVVQSFDDATDAVNRNTIALGENYEALVLRDLQEDPALERLVSTLSEQGTEVNELLDALGVDISDFIAASASGEDGAIDFLSTALDNAKENIDDFSPAVQQLITDFSRINQGVLGEGLQIGGLEGLFTAGAGQISDFIDAATGFDTGAISAESIYAAQDIGLLISRIQDLTNAAIQEKQILDALNNSTGVLADTSSDLAEENDDLGNSFTGVAEKMRTVLDYSNDIGGIFDRIMDIEFGEIEAQDDIADGWEKIAEKAADAQEAMKEANLEIKDLEADKDVLEYQLSVAERYGDEQRAAIIRAKLAKTNEKLADEEKKFNDAQAESEMGLEGNSKAARENRDALIGLVGEYGNLIQAAIDSGMQGQELEDYIRDLKEEFIEQAESVGFSRSELVKYEDIFDGFMTTVKNVDPRVDIEFDSNISAAQQALREYEAALNRLDGRNINTSYSHDVNQPDPLKRIVDDRTWDNIGRALKAGQISLMKYYELVFGVDPFTFAKSDLYDTRYMYRATGGYVGTMENGGKVTGPGGPTSDSIPTMLSNGEYVIQASAVRSYGVDFMNALNQQRLPMASMPSNATNGVAGGGSNIVYLSPQDRALLRQVADRPVNLYADNGKIAQSANAGNVMLSQRGLN